LLSHLSNLFQRGIRIVSVKKFGEIPLEHVHPLIIASLSDIETAQETAWQNISKSDSPQKRALFELFQPKRLFPALHRASTLSPQTQAKIKTAYFKGIGAIPFHKELSNIMTNHLLTAIASELRPQ
jgi:hypothetical protein